MFYIFIVMKIAEGWNYSLQESDCLNALPDVDPVLLRSVLSRLGEQLKDGVWCLDRNRVAQNAARLLLRAEAPTIFGVSIHSCRCGALALQIRKIMHLA